MNRLKFCAVFAAGVLLVWPAVAQPRGGGPRLREMFNKADANGDGKVTLDELHAVRPEFPAERFKGLDRNGDGALSKEDLPPGMGPGGEPGRGGPPLMALLKKADADQDQRVTLEELKAAAPAFIEEWFKKLDRNGDGALSKEDRPERPEPGQWGVGERPRKDKGGPGKARFGGRQRAGEGRPDRGQFLEKLKQGDANADGKITYEEARTMFPNMPEHAFGRMDRNGDGVLSAKDKRPRH